MQALALTFLSFPLVLTTFRELATPFLSVLQRNYCREEAVCISDESCSGTTRYILGIVF